MDVLNAMKQRLYRDRRRLTVVTLLAAVSGYLFYWRFSGQAVNGIPVPVITALFYAVGIGLAGIIFSLFIPKLRRTLELFAASRLIFSIAAAASPTVSMAAMNSPMLNATVVVLGGTLIGMALRGPRPARVMAWIDGAPRQAPQPA